MNAGYYRFRFYLNARHIVIYENISSGIHPHTWEIVLHIKKGADVFVQFSELENDIKKFLSSYEGSCLNETEAFNSTVPTMENIGDKFSEMLSSRLYEKGWKLLMLEISENPSRTYIVETDCASQYSSLPDESLPTVVNTIIGTDAASVTGDTAISEDTAVSGDTATSEDMAISEDTAANRVSTLEGLEEVSTADDTNSDVRRLTAPIDTNNTGSSEVLKRYRKRKKKVSNTCYLLIGVFILLIAASALFFILTRSGMFPWGSDSWYHLFKGHMLYLSIKEGNVYPLYSDIWYNGIQPLRYWAPLPHYVLALFEFMTGGNTGLSYNLFLAFVYIVGGIGWILWGAKSGRRKIALILAVIWTLLPDNLRVTFSEGNISRVMVTAIFPYLLLAVYMYLTDDRQDNEGNAKCNKYQLIYLCVIPFLMVLITFCHAMISAMVAVTVTLFSVIYGLSEKKVAKSLHIVAATACGIAAAGIWLVPALSGGLLSMNSEAVKELAGGLTYPMLETLDPTRRLADPNVFYFGTSIFTAAIFGLIFGDKKNRAPFAVTLIIFAGTTKALLPLILKLPLSQAFWMMRFTPLAMGTFFAGLIMWKRLDRKILALILIMVIADSSVSFVKLAHNSDMPEKAVDILNIAATMTDNRIALLDNSTMGSFPSFYLSFNDSGKVTRQVFGSGWQGASTARNIMLLNTAAENGWYRYMFDRCLEYGADTVAITGEMAKDHESLIKSAKIAGYHLAYTTERNELIFKYPVKGSFGTIARYKGLGIGRYASNLSLVFPQMAVGTSNFADDYSVEELSKYEVVYLSGFTFRNREAAEKLIRQVSEAGTRVVVDLTNAEAELLSSRAGFLGVIAETAQFEDKMPEIETSEGVIGFKSSIPEEYPQWRSIYLENLDSVMASTYYEDQQMDVIGTKLNDNIVFIGMNLPYYAMLTGDMSAVDLLENALGLEAADVPDRRIVKLEMEIQSNMISLKSDEPGVITGIAAQDTFQPLKGEFSVSHDIVVMNDTELTLKAGYPELNNGLAVSAFGIVSLIVLVLFLRRKKGGDVVADEKECL